MKYEKELRKLHGCIPNLVEYYTDKDVCSILDGMEEIDVITIVDDFMDEIWETPVRRCTNCGRLMKKGYLLDADYACSDKCRNEIYKKRRGAVNDEEAEKCYLMDCYDLTEEDVKGKTIGEIEEENMECDISDDYMYTEWY